MTSVSHASSPTVTALQARVAELEAALRASEDRTRLLLDSTAEAIYGIDLAGCCTFANASCLRLLGYQHEDELLGKGMHDLVHHSRPGGSPYPIEECQIHGVLVTGQGVHFDDEVLWRVDGVSVSVECWSYPIHQNSHVVGAVVTLLDITERRRTEEYLQRHAREMAALYEISLEINSEYNLRTLLQLIVERAAGLLDVQMGGLYLMRADKRSLELVVGCNLPGDYVGTVLQLGEGLSGCIAQTGQPMMIPDYQQWDGRAAVYNGDPFRRVLGVPLKVGEKVLGVINLSDAQKSGDFSADDVRLASLFADQAALAVEKARLLETARSDLGERYRAEQVQTALFRISEAAHAALDVVELCAAIHQIVNQLMPARNFGIALQDAATDMLHFPYYVDEGYASGAPVSRRRGHGLIEHVLRTGEALLGTMEDIQALIQREHIRPLGKPSAYWLGVPLKAQQRTIGVVVVQTYRPAERLTEEHRQILMFVSSQIAMVLQRKRMEQAQVAHYHIAAAALTANNLKELYTAIHHIVGEVMPARNFYIALYDPAEDTVDFAYFVDEMEQNPTERLRRHGHGLTEYVLQRGEPWLGTRAMIEDLLAQEVVTNVGPLAVDWLGVPLKVDGEPIGVIVVQSYSENERLSEEDKDLLLFVSAQVAMAIQRRRAEDALRDSEQRYRALFDAAQRQAQELALLDQARTVLLRELDLKAMSIQVVSAVAETFGYEMVCLYLRSGDRLILQHQVGYPWPRSVVSPDEGIIGRVVRSGQPVLVPDVTHDADFINESEDVVSEIAVPLFDGDQVAGVLNIETTRSAGLSDSDLRMMIALSEHISLAINRAKLYEQARESAARLTAAIESLPFDFWVMDADGRYVMQNAASTQRWGNSVGLPPEEVVAEPAILAVWREQNRRAFAGETIQGEITYVRDSVPRHYHQIVSPIWDGQHVRGILGADIDITDRRQAEEALRASEARLRAVISNVPLILFMLDPQGKFLFSDGKGLALLGLQPGQVVGLSAYDVYRDAPDVLASVERSLRGEAFSTVVHVIDLVFEVWYSPLWTDAHELAGVLAVAVDVTEREQAEEALRRAQKMESLGILAGGIAHDFNNLLVGMLGQTSLALRHLDIHHPARPPVEKAITAARRAADLTRQLLAYSGRAQFERRSLQLNRLIQDNLHLFEVAVPKHVRLQSELFEPLPLLIGDAGQLQQVVMNLIINAAEALGEQAGAVMVRTCPYQLLADEAPTWQIDQEALEPGEYVLLEVQDNGCGMSPDTLAKIFDPFFTTKFTGRGLGLAAVLGIVRGHHGGLRVMSEIQQGTRFELIFPGAAAQPVELAAKPEVLQETVMTQTLVLIIDDEEPVRDAVTDILDIEGLLVISASDGWEGIALYRKRQAEIGLVILDLSMPGLSGEATLVQLRQVNPQVRVLLSSGYSQTEVAARFAGQQAVNFMQKPFDLEQLVREVKQQLAA